MLLPVFIRPFWQPLSIAVPTNTVGFQNIHERMVLAASILPVSGQRMRLTLTSPSTGNNTSIQGFYIGHKGAGATDFDGTQVQVKVGGSGIITLTAGGAVVVSDEIVYPFNRANQLVIAIGYANVATDAKVGTGLGANYNEYEKVGDGANASATAPSGMGSAGSGVMAVVSKIEVFG